MNARSLLRSLALAAALPCAGPAAAAVPPVDAAGSAALSGCPAQLAAPAVYHFDKIVFSIGSSATGGPTLKAASPNDQPAVDALPRRTDLDIKVKDNPRAVADLKGKVLAFLGAAPSAENRLLVAITQVAYAAVLCPKAP
jgi:hypothetical protein